MQHQGPGRPRNQPSDSPLAPRKEAIDAAIAVIRRDGLEAATISAVAREVKVARTVVYHHFGDHDGLITAIGNSIMQPLFAKVTELAEADIPAEERLTSYLRFEAALLAKTDVPLLAIVTNPRLAEPGHSRFWNSLHELQETIVDWIVDATGLDRNDADLRATFATSAVLGMLALSPDRLRTDLNSVVALECTLLGISPV
jgi:AcrR family transcriptional regulator